MRMVSEDLDIPEAYKLQLQHPVVWESRDLLCACELTSRLISNLSVTFPVILTTHDCTFDLDARVGLHDHLLCGKHRSHRSQQHLTDLLFVYE